MAKKLVNGIIEEPELLAGLDVKWDKYVPSGSYEFQKFLIETAKPSLIEAKEVCQKRRDELASAKVVLVDLRKKIDAFASLTLASSDSFLTRVLGEDLTKKLSENIGLADEMMKKANSYAPDPKELADIASDIAFIDGVISFFENDLALDMLLFSLSVIDNKFKTKVFRQALKHLRIVEENIVTVENSKSPFKTAFPKELMDGFNELKDLYKTLGFGLRRQKKELDKLGQIFWESKWNMADKEVA